MSFWRFVCDATPSIIGRHAAEQLVPIDLASTYHPGEAVRLSTSECNQSRCLYSPPLARPGARLGSAWRRRKVMELKRPEKLESTMTPGSRQERPPGDSLVLYR